MGVDPTKRLQLLVELGYDGRRFHGLQPQPGLATAGGALRKRFEDAGVTPKALCYAARTDAGVHAERNLATCWLRGPADLERVIQEVQTPREDGLTRVRLSRVPIHVHARAIAMGKHYRYLLEDGWPIDPPAATDCWRIHPTLEVEPMRQAAAHLVGEHDFHAFRAKRCHAPNPVKRLTRVDVRTLPASAPGRRYAIDVEGNGFLRHMVRILVGTLAGVGAGLREPDAILALLAARNRAGTGPTAPPQGLTLVEVKSNWRVDNPPRDS